MTERTLFVVWAVPYRLHKRRVFNWTFWVVVLLAIALAANCSVGRRLVFHDCPSLLGIRQPLPA
jgi:hypothetical protein